VSPADAVPPGDAVPPVDDAVLGHLNLVELSRESTRWGTGGALEESDGIVLFATGSWMPVVCNGAFRSDDTASASALIERAEAFFGARRRGYTVMVRDTPADDDLRRACEKGGLAVIGEPAPEMICTTAVPDHRPPGIELRIITTAAGVADFAAVTGAAYSTYGMPVDTAAELLSLPHRVLSAPHLVTVVAYDGDEPLAGAMTFLSHGIAGLYWVGTVEKARRSGLGRAVTAAVTNAAFARGAASVTLQASVMGEPVYRSLGYRTLYHYEDWVHLKASAPGPAPSS
jgi:ribosomal protein S18 acetylase RimI-like enzyme